MPYKGDRKTEHIFLGVKGENRARRKKKKDKKENRTEKERKLRKKNENWFNRVCTHRSVSLSLPSNLTSFQNANKDFFFWTTTIQVRLSQNHQSPWQDPFPERLFALRRGVLSFLALLRQTKLKT